MILLALLSVTKKMNQKQKPLFLRSRATAVILSLLTVAAFSAAALEIPRAFSSAPESLNVHARFLASDELTGRGVDTPGIRLARDYIAGEFARYGLRPGGDRGTYLQSFEITTGGKVTEPSFVSLNGEAPLELNTAWRPLALSASGKVEGELVFAGYGITAKEHGYDDYEGIDAKGKIVLVLRYEPSPKNGKSPFLGAPPFSTYASLRSKARNAREHGAAGLILVDLNQTGAQQNELIASRRGLSRGANSLVAVQVKRDVLEPWLQRRGISLLALKDQIDRTERPTSISLPGIKVAVTVTLEEFRERAENVVGILPGSDARLKNEHVLIGAHYDHLGFGYYGTGDSGNEGKVHHGADDNASGTAVLLRIAEQLAAAEPAPPRAIVFVAFSGEELGLHGSRHYASDPALPLSSAKAMINLDMVGRLRENTLTVFGTRSGTGISAIVAAEARNAGMEIRESDDIGRSDNLVFYNKKVPALHFFTGIHADYHRPSDTWDKLNYEGMDRIAGLVLAVTRRLATTTEPFQFVALPSRRSSSEAAKGAAVRTYLGSIPDYAGNDDGVRLAGVLPGSPAALAGLREGDVITSFAGVKIANLEDLTAQLSSKRPGDEVEIVVLRSRLPYTIKATLAARN
ncbi:MAG TPA: M28 family peptidase [Candidatus Binatia bacterium]|nr:M28 family peptidase [Candidatus Binatia bacterium]